MIPSASDPWAAGPAADRPASGPDRPAPKSVVLSIKVRRLAKWNGDSDEAAQIRHFNSQATYILLANLQVFWCVFSYFLQVVTGLIYGEMVLEERGSPGSGPMAAERQSVRFMSLWSTINGHTTLIFVTLFLK